MAGVSIVYSALAGSNVASVPTLGTLATIGLSLCTAAAGAYAVRGKGMRMLAVAASVGTLTTLLASGSGQSAWASVRDYFSDPAGATLIYDSDENPADTLTTLGTIPGTGGMLCAATTGALVNGTSATLSIDSVTVVPLLSDYSVHTNDANYNSSYSGSTAGRCKPGVTRLLPGQSCQVILQTNVC